MALTDHGLELDTRPLSGTIGAEIHGLDLHQPLSPRSIEQVRAAWVRYKVIFFPGAHLSPEEHVRFAGCFGPVTAAHPVLDGKEGHSSILELDYTRRQALGGYSSGSKGRDDTTNGGKTRVVGVPFHIDLTFLERPPAGAVLSAVVVPPNGGDTLFADLQAAYRGLSDPFQRFLDGLRAVHDGRKDYANQLSERGSATWEGEETRLGPVTHPLVRTHPVSGLKSIFASPSVTTHIDGLSGGESNAILAYLYQRCTAPEYVVRYHWQAGDVVVWDNRSTMHAVAGDFEGKERLTHRVMIGGDAPS